jgi:hypothetical protein
MNTRTLISTPPSNVTQWKDLATQALGEWRSAREKEYLANHAKKEYEELWWPSLPERFNEKDSSSNPMANHTNSIKDLRNATTNLINVMNRVRWQLSIIEFIELTQSIEIDADNIHKVIKDANYAEERRRSSGIKLLNIFLNDIGYPSLCPVLFDLSNEEYEIINLEESNL